MSATHRCDRNDPVVWALLALMACCCAIPATALAVAALLANPGWQKLIAILFGALAVGSWYGAWLIWPRREGLDDQL